ncbi:hypothetical protein M434DRAFT_27453 [Hypoxylon sp. CO27-5]|nr:hypothetical protein M434DRAFT_27453 [Hypoxylon sp. CO27-5]
MPSAQPTCAARVISSKFVQNGWSATLSKETNEMVSRVKQDAEGMYQLELSRDRPISSTSMRSAIFWEHRHLIQQKIISTPAIDDELELELFSEPREKIQSRTGFQHIKKQLCDEVIKMHPIFEPIREREFTLWNARVEGAWVTLFFRVESIPMQSLGDNEFFDRKVTRMAIIDSLPEARDVRRKLLEKRLPVILAQGCIYLTTTSIETFEIEPTTHKWSTGLVAYAISREIFRRLKVLLHRRQSQVDLPIDFLWAKFEENYDIDVYRQQMLAACAHRTIENTNYNVRISLDVPSDKANHIASALQHVSIDPELVPDELYTKNHYTARTAVTEIPEGYRRQDVEKSDSEMSDADNSESKSDADESKQTSPVLEKPATEDVNFEVLLDSRAMDVEFPEPAKQNTADGESLDNQSKRALSIEASNSESPPKKQKIEEETSTSPAKSSTPTPPTPAPEQKEGVSGLVILNSIEHDSPSPDVTSPISEEDEDGEL